MSSLIKNILIFAVLAGVLYAGYYIFFAGNSSDLVLDDRINEGEMLASEFLIRINELEGIDFSRSFFEDDRLRSLVSFSITPETVSAGRDNPFSR